MFFRRIKRQIPVQSRKVTVREDSFLRYFSLYRPYARFPNVPIVSHLKDLVSESLIRGHELTKVLRRGWSSHTRVTMCLSDHLIRKTNYDSKITHTLPYLNPRT